LSGFMGFGWEALADVPGLPWWQNLMSRGTLQDPLFGVYIARHLLEEGGGENTPGGTLDLGFTNTAYYSGNIAYIDQTASPLRYWQVPVQSLNINGHDINAGNTTAVLDTGTSWIIAPTNVIAGLFAQVPGARRGTGDLEDFYVVPCNSNATLSFTIGGISYDINVVDWVVKEPTTQTCVGTIEGIDLESVTWVLGDTFLKNVYSVYRYAPPSVGFAQLSPAVKNAGTTTSVTSLTTTTPSTTNSISSSSSTASYFSTVWVQASPPPTSKGASSGGPALPGKVILTTCALTLLWIALPDVW